MVYMLKLEPYHACFERLVTRFTSAAFLPDNASHVAHVMATGLTPDVSTQSILQLDKTAELTTG